MIDPAVESLAAVISPGADRLARFLIKSSPTALTGDPEFDLDGLVTATGMSQDALGDAAEDLLERDLVEIESFLNGRDTPFDVLTATDRLFALYDGIFGDTDPAADAHRLAKDLLNEAISTNASTAAAQYGWSPRRMNPAVALLIALDVLMDDDLCGSYPWRQHELLGTRKLRRFVESAG